MQSSSTVAQASKKKKCRHQGHRKNFGLEGQSLRKETFLIKKTLFTSGEKRIIFLAERCRNSAEK